MSYMRERGGRGRRPHLETLNHVVGIYLDTAHVELHGPDMLEDLCLHYPVRVATADKVMVLVELLVGLVTGSLPRCFVVLLFERVQDLELLGKEGLGVDRLNLELRRVGVPPGQLESVHGGVLDGFFIEGDGRSFGVMSSALAVAISITIGLLILCGAVRLGPGEWLVEVYRPPVAHELDIESLSEHPNLAPRVPVRWDGNLVSLNNVVF